MFDSDKLLNDLNHGKQYRPIVKDDKERGWAFNFAKPSVFDDGSYKCRLLPIHPDRNPDHYRIVTFHRIETVPGQKPVSVLGHESVDEERKSFYIDKLLQAISDAHELEGPDFVAKMDDGLKDALQKLYPWRRYVFPMIFWAEAYPNPQGKKDSKGNTLLNYRPTEEGPPIGILWEVNSPPGKNAPKVLTSLFEMGKMHPDLGHKKKGRNLKFMKNRYMYTLLPEDVSPFPKEAEHLLGDDKYPKLASMYKDNNRSHSDIVSLIQNAWWAPDLEKLGISLEDDTSSDSLDLPAFEI